MSWRMNNDSLTMRSDWGSIGLGRLDRVRYMNIQDYKGGIVNIADKVFTKRDFLTVADFTAEELL